MVPSDLVDLEIESVQSYFWAVNAFEDAAVSLTFAERDVTESADGEAIPVDGVVRAPTAFS